MGLRFFFLLISTFNIRYVISRVSFFMDLSRSNNSNSRFNRLTCVDSGLFFFCSLFLIFFISFFNVGLVGN